MIIGILVPILVVSGMCIHNTKLTFLIVLSSNCLIKNAKNMQNTFLVLSVYKYLTLFYSSEFIVYLHYGRIHFIYVHNDVHPKHNSHRATLIGLPHFVKYLNYTGYIPHITH